MIGVVIPAHNEQMLLGFCLRSVLAACWHPELEGREFVIVVVLDACDDRSGEVAADFPVEVLRCAARCVGVARALGAARAIAAGATWLAFTDADTEVGPDWLAAQLRLGADAVCGTIEVAWSDAPQGLRQDFEQSYLDSDGHRHVHGANLGLRVDAYLAVGGMPLRDTGEDVGLVEALQRHGRTIAWSAAPRVRTSARLDGRARHGFASTLRDVAQRLARADRLLPVLYRPMPVRRVKEEIQGDAISAPGAVCASSPHLGALGAGFT